MSTSRQSQAVHWDQFEPALPAELSGSRVLLVATREAAEDLSAPLSDRGATVVPWDSIGDLDADASSGGFELAVCAELLQTNPHPARVLGGLWGAMQEGATLLLHSRVLAGPGESQYARFVAAAAAVGPDEWLPGRLALRWSLETSGFDVERWLSAGEDSPRSRETSAYLQAKRMERLPSLMLATPTDPTGGA